MTPADRLERGRSRTDRGGLWNGVVVRAVVEEDEGHIEVERCKVRCGVRSLVPKRKGEKVKFRLGLVEVVPHSGEPQHLGQPEPGWAGRASFQGSSVLTAGSK